MTLAQLIARYRTAAHDKAQPYFASDEEVTEWLNDAVREAAIRGRLIHESADPLVCRIAVEPDQSVYPLHAALYELTYLAVLPADGARPCGIRLISEEALDAARRDWRYGTGPSEFAIQGDKSLRLAPTPRTAGTLVVEGYRLPMTIMELADKDTAEPEINESHHIHLVQWALFRAFSIPDSELLDPNRAALAEDEFTRYFGARPDSDLRRITREDVPHHVEAFWP